MIALSLLLAAQSVDWRVATIDKRAISFIDAGSRRRAGNHITFRFEVHFRDKRDVARMSAQISADCTAISVTDIQAIGYRVDETSADVSDVLRRSAIPGSNLAGLIAGTCTGTWLTEAPVDPAIFASEFFKML